MRQLILPFRQWNRFIRFVRLALTADTSGAALDIVKVIISAFGVLATIFAGVGLFLTYQNSQAERQLNTERLVTDRFAKAFEQLGSQDIHVRLGAIYSLERIAKDSPKDHWTVMEVLSAYVRNKSPLPQNWAKTVPKQRKPLPNATTDVQSALTVLRRREVKNDPVDSRLDLSGSNLNGADLSRAYLDSADFRRSSLTGTNFSGAILNFANFGGSTLRSARLDGAKLRTADLRDADLRDAEFFEADLSIDPRTVYMVGAICYDADFTGANLTSANLDGADLRGADFREVRSLNPEQLKQAGHWRDAAHYDTDFRKQLGLPPEKH